MIRNRSTRLAVVALATVLILAGCGSDDDGGSSAGGNGGGGGAGAVSLSGEAETFAREAAEALRADSDFPGGDEQADCFISRSVETIGFDRIEAAGITPAEFGAGEDGFLGVEGIDLTEDDGNRIFDGFEACGLDLDQMMATSFEDDEASPATVACFETALAGDNLRKFFVGTLVYDDEELAEKEEYAPVMASVFGCLFMELGEAFEDAEGFEPTEDTGG